MSLEEGMTKAKEGYSGPLLELFEEFYDQYRKKEARLNKKTMANQRRRKRMLDTNLDKIIARATKKKEKLKQKRETIKTYPNDPNMLYYPDLRLWVSKNDLRRTEIRLALGAVHNNPYWDRGDKVSLFYNIKNVSNAPLRFLDVGLAIWSFD